MGVHRRQPSHGRPEARKWLSRLSREAQHSPRADSSRPPHHGSPRASPSSPPRPAPAAAPQPSLAPPAASAPPIGARAGNAAGRPTRYRPCYGDPREPAATLPDPLPGPNDPLVVPNRAMPPAPQPPGTLPPPATASPGGAPAGSSAAPFRPSYGPPAADGLPDPIGVLELMRNTATAWHARGRAHSPHPSTADSPTDGSGRAGSRRPRRNATPSDSAIDPREATRVHVLAHIGHDPGRIAGFCTWAGAMGHPDTPPQQASLDLLELYAVAFLQVSARDASPSRRVERRRGDASSTRSSCDASDRVDALEWLR